VAKTDNKEPLAGLEHLKTADADFTLDKAVELEFQDMQGLFELEHPHPGEASDAIREVIEDGVEFPDNSDAERPERNTLLWNPNVFVDDRDVAHISALDHIISGRVAAPEVASGHSPRHGFLIGDKPVLVAYVDDAGVLRAGEPKNENLHYYGLFLIDPDGGEFSFVLNGGAQCVHGLEHNRDGFMDLPSVPVVVEGKDGFYSGLGSLKVSIEAASTLPLSIEGMVRTTIAKRGKEGDKVYEAKGSISADWFPQEQSHETPPGEESGVSIINTMLTNMGGDNQKGMDALLACVLNKSPENADGGPENEAPGVVGEYVLNASLTDFGISAYCDKINMGRADWLYVEASVVAEPQAKDAKAADKANTPSLEQDAQMAMVTNVSG
jgi:hypothetical protein